MLQKNELFGGCFQTYPRKGHLLDTGIHYIGSLDEGQVMNQFFRYVGIMDHLKVRKLDENAFDKIFYKNRVYDYAMGYELSLIHIFFLIFHFGKMNFTSTVA